MEFTTLHKFRFSYQAIIKTSEDSALIFVCKCVNYLQLVNSDNIYIYNKGGLYLITFPLGIIVPKQKLFNVRI